MRESRDCQRVSVAKIDISVKLAVADCARNGAKDKATANKHHFAEATTYGIY
jgi:hypothetical protein